MKAPIKTTTKVIAIRVVDDNWVGLLANPTTGSSQVSILPQNSNAMPKKVEPIAKMTRGMVMTAGDSCGCTSSSHRALPKKVIAIMRVM